MDNTDINQQPIKSAEEIAEDKKIEIALRPKKLTDFVGQNKIKNNLEIFLQAAKNRQEPIDHVLFYGPPGLGKTTLSHIIAEEMQANLKVTTGPAIEKSGDLAAILTNMQPGDILFIDEIHRLNKTVEEILYPAMEDFVLDIVIGKGPSARTVRLELPHFTIIGATTKLSKLSAPLRDRFGNVYRLDFYQDDEIDQIVKRSAQILNVNFVDQCSFEIAVRARKTPRIANRLLKRVRDFAEVKNGGIINTDIVNSALNLLEIDQLGLDEIDRKILLTIIEKFNGGPVGLNTLSASTSEEMDTIEDVIEPFLLQLGFINRTPRGRVVTCGAYKHLNLDLPNHLSL
ncbi:Holliday junction DNA helicase RuvB [Candidatus Falkowbacteria bacterium RIFOXYD2_FULL_35_9]|uniref:Holliday junction branch migration complex subunit RuvB n=1 Tax=Candidatus Falkowbacteria bacterium RIFOXYC2_FULL_36_12 TaxID=1798002 RepID=A0A1F5T391_9BACT|nr:MAG: Holliday junction DNA helicase RuvB [Candidatus Falkowbacteria bacterium RIFOXYB2_FULL_35_7]OGF33434.1 MAG: Holliday junction DNA helicase RuvB [Candidatus Falkowbacteria bacterium RIFOXYC2_FULL_36_12]OGF47587.1 MAG: Holliday junction DNA helicase RuvB [Candidatus Falkowbacteria bacterium RIFOXYD2_FULL_35_9]